MSQQLPTQHTWPEYSVFRYLNFKGVFEAKRAGFIESLSAELHPLGPMVDTIRARPTTRVVMINVDDRENGINCAPSSPRPSSSSTAWAMAAHRRISLRLASALLRTRLLIIRLTSRRSCSIRLWRCGSSVSSFGPAT